MMMSELNMPIILNRIYEEDCIPFMNQMKEENILVDTIVTSPPYNINKEYGEYKDNLKPDKYLEWLQKVAKASQLILKYDGSFFLNIGSKRSEPLFPFLVANEFLKAGYILQNTTHWIKSISIDPEDRKNNGSRNNENLSIGHFKPINSERYLTDLQEYIFQFTKTGNVKIDKRKVGVTYQDKSNIDRWKSATEDKRDRGNVWVITYPTIQAQEERPHPAVFPVKLPRRCIELHGIKPDMIVYDPFMGIGNTALACIDLGVNYIGTEINPQYIKVAEDEIRIAKGQIFGKIDTYLQDRPEDKGNT